MKNLRSKYPPSFKAKVALEAIKEEKPRLNYPANTRCILVRLETGRLLSNKELRICLMVTEKIQRITTTVLLKSSISRLAN